MRRATRPSKPAACKPERAGDFVAAVAVCLGLNESEHSALLHRLAIDLLVFQLGREFTEAALGRAAEL